LQKYFILLFISCFIYAVKGALNGKKLQKARSIKKEHFSKETADKNKDEKLLILFFCSHSLNSECNKTFYTQRSFEEHERIFHANEIKEKSAKNEGKIKKSKISLKKKKKASPVELEWVVNAEINHSDSDDDDLIGCYV